MRVVAYLRVSTKRQVKGESLAEQLEAISEWAARRGWEVVEVCEDGGKRGALPATERPGLLEALTMIEQGEADCLAVLNLGRLARALHVQEAVLSRVWGDEGVAWEAGPDREVLQDDPDDPMRTFVRQVTGAAHQLEGALIRQRLQGARRRKRARGGYVGGRGRYGYRIEGTGKAAVFVPIPDEQVVLDRMKALRRKGRSLRGIAATLNAQGVPAKLGGEWRHTSVRSALKGAEETSGTTEAV